MKNFEMTYFENIGYILDCTDSIIGLDMTEKLDYYTIKEVYKEYKKINKLNIQNTFIIKNKIFDSNSNELNAINSNTLKNVQFINCKFNNFFFLSSYFENVSFDNCEFNNTSIHGCYFKKLKINNSLLTENSMIRNCCFDELSTYYFINNSSNITNNKIANTDLTNQQWLFIKANSNEIFCPNYIFNNVIIDIKTIKELLKYSNKILLDSSLNTKIELGNVDINTKEKIVTSLFTHDYNLIKNRSGNIIRSKIKNFPVTLFDTNYEIKKKIRNINIKLPPLYNTFESNIIDANQFKDKYNIDINLKK